MLVMAAMLLAYSMATNKRETAQLAMILMVSAIPITFILWGTASRAHCPLCIGNPLANRTCSTHSRTCKLFGSYRLPVAISVIFTGKFRCPYCGELTAVASRGEQPHC